MRTILEHDTQNCEKVLIKQRLKIKNLPKFITTYNFLLIVQENDLLKLYIFCFDFFQKGNDSFFKDEKLQKEIPLDFFKLHLIWALKN